MNDESGSDDATPDDSERAGDTSADTANSDAAPDPALTFLTDMAARLDGAAGKANDTQALGELPGWVAGFGHQASPTVAPDQIAKIAAGAHPAKVRALAMLWLADHKRPDDVAVMEAALDSTEPAGQFPSVYPQQRVSPSYPVQWTEYTLGQVALLAIQRSIGRPLASVAEYRSWKSEVGELKKSVAYWVGALKQIHDASKRNARLAALKQDSPVLYVRTILAADEPSWDPDLPRFAASVIKPQRMTQLVQRDQVWPELREAAEFSRFASWAYQHAEIVLGPEHKATLLALWQFERHPGVEHLRRDLAVATSRANPDYRRSVLTTVLTDAPTPHMAIVLEPLTYHHLDEEFAVIAKWFMKFSKSSAIADNRVAIITAASKRGAAGRKALGKLVKNRKFRTDNAAVIAALGAAVVKLGGAIDDRCQSRINLLPPLKKGHRITNAERKAAARARRSCLRDARAWLRKS